MGLHLVPGHRGVVVLTPDGVLDDMQLAESVAAYDDERLRAVLAERFATRHAVIVLTEFIAALGRTDLTEGQVSFTFVDNGKMRSVSLRSGTVTGDRFASLLAVMAKEMGVMKDTYEEHARRVGAL